MICIRAVWRWWGNFGGLGGILAVCNIMNLGHFNSGLVRAIPRATVVQSFWYLKVIYIFCVYIMKYHSTRPSIVWALFDP